MAEGVDSANVVGYTTANVPQNTFYMLGLQYEKVGGGAMSVQEVKGTFNGVDYDDNYEFLQTAPNLQVWTPSGYDLYYYLNDAWSVGDVYSAGWADNWGVLADGTITPGQGAWFKDPNEVCTVTTPGQVVATAASVSAAKDIFTMGSVPYPASFEVNGVTWTGIQGVDYDDNYEFLQTAPNLQVWTPSGYDLYYYLNDAWSVGDVYSAGWADNWGVLATGSFPVGYGFWLKPTTAVTVGFTSPLSAN